MYNQEYEEYMRNVLGYSPNYQDNTYRNNDYYGIQNNQSYYNEKIEMMYPEIYRTVYPLVLREVGMNSRALTEETIEEMVDKIYNEISQNQNNRTIENEKNDVKVSNISTSSSNSSKNTRNSEVSEDRQSTRPMNNPLRDLIKILLLRELIGRPGFPNKPPFPGRPPFPGGPGMPPPRPRNYYM